MLKQTQVQTKKGIVSLYMVTFSAMLFGIITLSFFWIMTAETRLASNDDLSQSAYDAALAGIEDAKSILTIYNSCRLKNGQGTVNGQNCANLLKRMDEGLSAGSCDIISDIYSVNSNGGAKRDSSSGEVPLRESYTNNYGKNTNDEAYTCVKISTKRISSYRSYLSGEEISRMIPIQNPNVAGIKLQWYSKDTQITPIRYMGSASSPKFDDAYQAQKSVPILSFEFFQTEKSSFQLYQLDVSNQNNSGADHVMAMLYPYDNHNSNGTASDTLVKAQDLLDVSNLNPFKGNNSSSSYDSSPIPVSCGYSEGYLCHTIIEFPKTFTGEQRAQNSFVRIALPYGAPTTDFEITLCDSISSSGCVNSGSTFDDVQAVVDSTGRAGTLYRRLVANVDIVNTGDVYISNAIQIYNDGQGSKADINKNFYSTENCFWYEDGSPQADNGKCADNNKSYN